MVWFAISSIISSSISVSEGLKVLLSLAWKTTFSIFLTLVGDPDNPQALTSAFTSATLHSVRFRYFYIFCKERTVM